MLIGSEELIEVIDKVRDLISVEAYCAITERLKELPSAQHKGKWIGYNTEKEGWKRTDGSPVFISCSECNATVLNNGSAHWNYCPNCGARMEGEEE